MAISMDHSDAINLYVYLDYVVFVSRTVSLFLVNENLAVPY